MVRVKLETKESYTKRSRGWSQIGCGSRQHGTFSSTLSHVMCFCTKGLNGLKNLATYSDLCGSGNGRDIVKLSVKSKGCREQIVRTGVHLFLCNTTDNMEL